MDMKEAIKKAIEGGYDNELGLFNLPNFSPVDERLVYAVLLLDPLFWQALGKAEGWEQPEDRYHWCQVNELGVKNGVSFFQGELLGETPSGISYTVLREGTKTPIKIHKDYIELAPRNEWRKVWHRFIDKLADGGDAEGFFKELLK